MKCVYCSKTQIRKKGFRYYANGVVQLYQCKICLKIFSFRRGFFAGYKKVPSEAVVFIILSYYSHPSVPQIVDELKQRFGIKTSQGTVSRVIREEQKLLSNAENKMLFGTAARQLMRLKRELGFEKKDTWKYTNRPKTQYFLRSNPNFFIKLSATRNIVILTKDYIDRTGVDTTCFECGKNIRIGETVLSKYYHPGAIIKRAKVGGKKRVLYHINCGRKMNLLEGRR